MSVLDELKRRNVFRVGAAYAVAAWVLLQILDVVGEILELPAWGGKLILAIIMVGFFVTLFIAWAFELTPEGIKQESEVDRRRSVTARTGRKLNRVIFVLMAVAVTYLLFDKFYLAPHLAETELSTSRQQATRSPESSVEAKAASSADRLSIAVLPFDNRSNREEDQFFTDGIHDDLLTTIARIGSMKVISRTSVMEYRDTTKKIPEIARELGVANILEGGIQRSGTQVRVNVQLIDAQSDQHLWAETFDRELTAKNLFAIQSEISQAVASALQATLTPQEIRRINAMPTQDLAAYNAYMRGKQLMATRVSTKLGQATLEFRKAVDLDPNFDLAWVGLADAYFLLPIYGSFNPDEALEIRQDAIDRALKIDPELGEAYVSLSSIYFDEGKFDQAEAASRRAIELSPNYATAYHFFGGQLQGLSRGEEKIALIQKAAELDPLSAIIGSSLADQYAGHGQFSRAVQQYKEIIESHPDFSRGYQGLGVVYGQYLGRFDLAIQNLRAALLIDPAGAVQLMGMGTYLIEAGDLESAIRYRQKLADTNARHWALEILDLHINHARGNAAGVRDAWNRASGNALSFQRASNWAGLLHLAIGNLESAREIFVARDPEWTEPEAWESLIDRNPGDACLVAWTLANTGDKSLGNALLDQTLAYFEELPTLVKHADYFNEQFCNLMSGDIEKALAHIETQLVHNHLANWMIYDQLPLYDQIRSEPRYQAALAERNRLVAEQRKVIDQMQIGEAL
jgi:TolB-like protein/Flp pilus assembly protein TadD